MRRLLTACAVTGCLLAGLPAIGLAESLPGLTIFSGVEGKNQLPFRLDFGGNTNGWDRYRLRIPAKKMKYAVSRLVITYPRHFRGDFDPKKMEVTVRDKKVALSEVKFDKENRVIELYLQEPIAAGSKTEVVLSNVKNPAFGGMFYFNCAIESPGDVLARHIGTWIISIN
ncbi:DUF2808 domain-containing protein [Calothrix sp. 336/3]|uniref:DUF2808 domain-containing protein n=1 Tax=Calothrix sp. 336/3 TaxID=1337936 RepID=UPI0004E2CE57|nr:DUF2808 domain-containing protein [Calothrix sp. 336/3]AKG24116.1 hypothetical protein IJ00_24860 [Calothrix sp. 336/3]